MTRHSYLSRCLCGLRAALHFDGPHMTGRKLDCAEAAKRHPYATCRCAGFKASIASSAFALVRRTS